jgi:hypothetical protein
VSNGSAVFNVDGRSAVARRCRDVLNELISGLAGIDVTSVTDAVIHDRQTLIGRAHPMAGIISSSKSWRYDPAGMHEATHRKQHPPMLPSPKYFGML